MDVIVKRLSGETDKCECSLPIKIFHELDLSEEIKYRIHVGQLSVYCNIVADDILKNEMIFPESSFGKLLLYTNANLNIWKENNDIYLGPVVGIFVNTRYLKSLVDGDAPLSAQKHMQANIEGKCLLYYFSIDNINWFESKIKGMVYIEGLGMWRSYWFPMPDVVYDRAVGFDTEQKLLANHIREQLGYNPNIHFINSKPYLSKWQCYKYLSKNPEVEEYLPKTMLYTNFDDVISMLSAYNFIFLKSSLGSRGREVLSVEQMDDGYRINFYSSGLKELQIKKDELKEYIDKFITDKQYIIQQGCRLLKYHGHSMDMRILIVKDGSGKWKATQNQCRIAKADATITNYSAGGSLVNYSDIYPELSKTINGLPDFDGMAEITIKVATYIEKEFGPFGEIGMDMAVDENGKVWFIEANAKPDKDPEPGLDDMEGIAPQCLFVLQYAKFLKKEKR